MTLRPLGCVSALLFLLSACSSSDATPSNDADASTSGGGSNTDGGASGGDAAASSGGDASTGGGGGGGALGVPDDACPGPFIGSCKNTQGCVDFYGPGTFDDLKTFCGNEKTDAFQTKCDLSTVVCACRQQHDDQCNINWYFANADIIKVGCKSPDTYYGP